MTDKLDDILKRMMEEQKNITDQRIRDNLAHDLQSAYMLAVVSIRYRQKNQEKTA